MKKKWVLIIFIAMLVLCIIPLFLDWVIFGNNVPSNLNNAEWASFLGSYIGAILSGGISLVGISITIYFTASQNKADRELHNRPYFDIRYKQTESITRTDKSLGYLAYSCDAVIEHRDNVRGILLLKNVGIGPAIDCNFSYGPIDDNRDHYPMIFVTNDVGTTSLQSGEEGSITINIAMNFPPISHDNIQIENGVPYILPIAYGKLKNHSIPIEFTYHDILLNCYKQTILMKVQLCTSSSDEGKTYHFGCDLYLDSVSFPKKVKKND